MAIEQRCGFHEADWTGGLARQLRLICFPSRDVVHTDVQADSLISKLVLLTLHFPRLRIIWSRALHATADVFRSLKTNQDDPDPLLAATTGKHEPIFVLQRLDMLEQARS